MLSQEYLEVAPLRHPMPAEVAVDEKRCRDIQAALAQRRTAYSKAMDALSTQAALLTETAAWLVATLRAGRRVLVAGNGGSAAQSQHFAAELVGRFKRERRAYPVLSLTADTASLTAIANDYGYQEAFARQVVAFGQQGDVLLAFSTSGESENLIRAATVARQQGMGIIAITGNRPSRLSQEADRAILVPLADTAMIQEMHLLVTHLLCDIVEQELMVNMSITSDTGN